MRELENFLHFLDISLQYDQKALYEKVFVVAALNRTSFKSLGMPKNSGGLVTMNHGYNIFVRCDGFRSSSKVESNLGRTAVLRALVHLFLHNASNELRLPVWYEEGIAEHFSTYMEKKDKIIIGDIRVLSHRVKSIANVSGGNRIVDTESLFKMSKADLDDLYEKDWFLLNRFFARADFVVHYMLADTKRTEELNHYLHSLNNGFSIDESFKKAFNMTFSELDKAVDNYIEGKLKLQVYNTGKDGLNFPDIEIEKHEISKRDILGLLYIRLSSLPKCPLDDRDFDELTKNIEKLYPGLVEDALQKLLTEHPDNPFALLRLARMYDRLNKYAEAIDMYERALLLFESDAFVLNNLAWLLVTTPDSELRNPKRAIELAEKAVAIERCPAYLDTLAEAYYVNGSIEKAIETINEAISLTNGEYEHYINQLKKFKEAEEKL